MNNFKEIDDAYKSIIKMNWSFDERFSKVFLTPLEVEKQQQNLHVLRKNKYLNIEEVYLIKGIIRHGRQRYIEFQEKLRNEPRRQAQRFIGKKNIREFIFKRDGYKCLCCKIEISLSIDHIVPISKGGGNKISNLQTLCTRCNSIKKDSFIDYRINNKK